MQKLRQGLRFLLFLYILHNLHKKVCAYFLFKLYTFLFIFYKCCIIYLISVYAYSFLKAFTFQKSIKNDIDFLTAVFFVIFLTLPCVFLYVYENHIFYNIVIVEYKVLLLLLLVLPVSFILFLQKGTSPFCKKNLCLRCME